MKAENWLTKLLWASERLFLGVVCLSIRMWRFSPEFASAVSVPVEPNGQCDVLTVDLLLSLCSAATDLKVMFKWRCKDFGINYESLFLLSFLST
jgi:hypothetical protein